MHQRGRILQSVWGYIGCPGTGKTTLARAVLKQETGEEPYIYKAKTNDWWDGYNGEKGVIMDDFNGDYNPVQLLGLLDPACEKINLMIKGGSIPCAVTHVIFTTNFGPWDWYDKKKVRVGALMRRFNGWFLFKRDGTHPQFYSSTEQGQMLLNQQLQLEDLGMTGEPWTQRKIQ